MYTKFVFYWAVKSIPAIHIILRACGNVTVRDVILHHVLGFHLLEFLQFSLRQFFLLSPLDYALRFHRVQRFLSLPAYALVPHLFL